MTPRVIPRRNIRHLVVTALSLLVCIVSVAGASPQVFFGPPLVEGERDLESHLLEFIAGARETLDASLFDLKSWPITEALVERHQAGVRVRLVTDRGRFFERWSGDETEPLRDTIQHLVDAGIEVKHDGRSALMHNKFFVADQRAVWTGSYNITERGTRLNWNNSIWMNDEEIARMFHVKFEDQFVHGEFGPRSTSRLDEQRATVDGVLYEVFFSPEDDPTTRIDELIRNATDNVYFMHYAFTHNLIGDALVDKHLAGYRVEGVFDHLLYRSTGPYAEFAKLTAAGVPVAVQRPPGGGIMHNKFFLIDAGTDNGIVITGSLNISVSGGQSNDENTVIIHCAETARLYLAEYERRKAALSPVVSEVVFSEPVVIGSVVPEMNIYVVTNNEPIRTVAFEFASRWRMEDDVVEGARVYRGQEDITETVDMSYSSQRLTLRGVDLTAHGDSRSLRIRLFDVPAPTRIPGTYSFYVMVGDADDHMSGLDPIAVQPTAQVFSEEEAGGLADRMDVFDGFLVNLASIDAEASTKDQQVGILRQYQQEFRGLENYILVDLSEGRYDRLQKLLTYLDEAGDSDSLIFRTALFRVRNLRRIVLGKSIHGADQQLLELAELMQEICERYVEDAKPLAPVDNDL